MSNPLKIIKEDSPWYSEGLNFKCTGCGQCCTGAPGYVWVSEEDIAEIAAHLNMSVEGFKRQYVRKVDNRYSLREHSKTYDCVFLEDGKRCKIYSVRPKQCSTFPWWPENLESAEAWKSAASGCEGICTTAEKVPLEKIKEQLTIYHNEPHLNPS